jgi:hypothetical protein
MIKVGLKPPSDTLRFCRSIEELPIDRLFDRPRIMVSFSQIQLVREIPVPENHKLELKAIGLFDPLEDEPALPCMLTISPDKSDRFGRSMISRVGHHRDPNGHFRLDVRIADESGEAARAVRDAFTAAALTNKEFLKVAFHTSACNPRARLPLLVAEGYCEGPEVNGLVFGAGMTLAAPEWSWAWDCRELDQAAFHDLNLARVRRTQIKR